MVMRRSALTLAATATLALLAAAPAAAHVEPTATEVPAGSVATVEFTVQHGCDGSPTTKLEFQVPEEITDAAPVDKDGWTGSADGRVITYEGGPLAPDVEDTFAVTFTAPDTVGLELAFPFVQTCEEGSIDWIQLEEDAERPAPIVTIGDPDPNAPQPTPTTTTEGTTDTTEPETTTTEAPETTVAEPTTTTAPGAADEAEDDGGSSAGVLIGGVVLMTAAAVGFGIWLRRRTDG
jgi:uncharacterized protein YcnI